MKINLTAINFTKGRKAPIKFIVIHYTANDGDTDEGNANYFKNVNRQASAHYFVDEDSITQVVLDENTAWHCNDTQKYLNGGGQYKKIVENANSIGIEMCSDKENGQYVITDKTIDNTVELVKTLLAKHNITVDNVIRHYDVTGKICPEPFVRNPELWKKFKEKLTEKEEPMYETFKDVPKWYQDAIGYYIKNGDLNDGKPLDGAIDPNYKINLAESTARALTVQYNTLVRLKLT